MGLNLKMKDEKSVLFSKNMLDFNWLEIEEFRISEADLAAWLSYLIKNEGQIEGEVSIVFVSDNALLSLNKEYLQHDYFTDIITFDYSEEEVYGDLFISVDRVKENAKSIDVSFGEELNRVMAHGVLHLCGYGDKSDDEKKTMREREDFYLNKLKGFT